MAKPRKASDSSIESNAKNVKEELIKITQTSREKIPCPNRRLPIYPLNVSMYFRAP
ncbi:MAG: hypothetical protein NPIRA03_21640 [Nitrospirales bacterium]|nr:MAG: hypothetical protein NPIRA03_21640 [Nitrospirales bacterium]